MRERKEATTKRRVVTGLVGLAFLAVGFMIQSALTILFALVGAALLLSVLPFGSSSLRRGRRYR